MTKNTNLKVRHWCVTFWNEPIKTNDERIRYSIFGKEICPETKKIHWQGYIEFSNSTRISTIKKIYNDKTVHCSAREKPRDAARAYCMKDNDFVETGKWIAGQGHRTDIDDVVSEMKTGRDLMDIALENPSIYCRYRNGLKDIEAHLIKKRTRAFRQVKCTLITGPTGLGKTRRAIAEAGDDYYKIQASSLSWFQGYCQETTLIIDEYNNNVSIDKLLSLLDGYQLELPVKGSHTYANWTTIYITTNLRCEELHANAKKAHRDALSRRLTTIIDMWDDGPVDEN